MPIIITLSIIGAIVALIAIIPLLNVSLILQYDDGIIFKVRVLFITIRLSSKEDSKDTRPWYEKLILYVKKLFNLFNKKSQGSKKDGEKGSGEKNKTSASNVIDTVKTICVIVKALLANFSRYLKIKIAKIHIKLATGDAARTAIAYGALTQSINVLFPLLEDINNFYLPKNRDIDISPDFLSEKSEVDIRLVFTLRVWQIVVTAASTLIKLIIHYIKSLERKETKNHGN